MVNLKFSSIREALHFRMTVSEDHYFDVEYFEVLLDLCLKDFRLLLKKWGSLTILPTFCTTNIHNFEKEIFIIR